MSTNVITTARDVGLAGGLESFAPVTLADVVDRADLAERVDRKYLIDRETVYRALGLLAGSHQILQIGGRRTSTYSTTYFDTADLTSCRAHIQGRRRRWKVRSRLYVEDGLCRIEVKTKDGRGITHKRAAESHLERHDQLGTDERQFISAALSPDFPEIDFAALGPTSRITYTRACLVNLAAQTRLTIDWNLISVLNAGRVWIDNSYAIVETKGGRIPGAADRLLVSVGAKPRAFSKYAATTSLLCADIADNDVRSLCGTQLHHQDARL